jgi:membrane associated rhomboid family serine protease
MMLVAFHLNGWKIEPLKVNPLAGPTPEVLLALGALNGRLMIETGSYYRLVTPIFLHAGIIHLLINALVLRLIGRTIERSHGFWITSALFFVPAIGANIISALMQPGYILVGASGGIFGLIGVLLAEIVLNWDLMFLVMKAKGARHGCWMRFLCIFWLVLDLFLNSAVGFTPFVDNYAHMGGLLYGYLIALTTIKTLPFSFFEENHCISHKNRLAILQGGGTVIPGFLILLSTVMLSRSDGLKSPCSRCRYISCIPFPFWTDNKLWYCDGCDAVSGQVYKRRGDAFFSDLEIHCPHGEVAKIDIFDENYSDDDIEYLNAVLHEFCREHCKID